MLRISLSWLLAVHTPWSADGEGKCRLCMPAQRGPGAHGK